MERVEGRGLLEPTLKWHGLGDGVVIRVDDTAIAEFWLQIWLPLEELQAMVRAACGMEPMNTELPDIEELPLPPLEDLPDPT